LILTLSIALLPQFTAPPQQLAPYGLPGTPPAVVQSQLDSQSGIATLEAFEAYGIANGKAEATGSTVINHTTITGTGQGPGLVLEGCTYSSAGGIQWNGQSYYGQTSRCILGASESLYLDYYSFQSTVSFTLNAFHGFADFVDVTAYNIAGSVVDSITQLSIPSSLPVPVVLTGNDICRVEISTGRNHGWTGILDNHEFDQDFTLTIPALDSGLANTVTTSFGVVGTTVVVAYTFGGSGPTNTPFGVMNLTMPIKQLAPEIVDAYGKTSATTFIPAIAAGRTVWVQALNITGHNTGVFSNSFGTSIL